MRKISAALSGRLPGDRGSGTVYGTGRTGQRNCRWFAISRGGLRRWLWPMAAALALPCGVYLYLAIALPQNFLLIASLIAVEQFGYGFGFSAFMMYLMVFSRGPQSTSHYAFCTAFMALGMMLPGMAAGWLFNIGGYVPFFWIVMGACLATFAATLLARRTLAADSAPEAD